MDQAYEHKNIEEPNRKVRVLFLAPYPFDQAPSQRFRFEHFFHRSISEKYEFAFRSFWSHRAWQHLYQSNGVIAKALYLLLGFIRRMAHILKAVRFDYIFIHRELTPVGPPLFEYILCKIFRKSVIYDFDDAIWLDNTSAENRLAGFVKNHGKVASICKWAGSVSVGNDYLAAFARGFNSNVAIIPTVVDTENRHNRTKKYGHANDPIVLGWTGTHSTNKYLYLLAGALGQLINKYNIEVMVISNKDPELHHPYTYVPWDKEHEIDQLLLFDIGIMPLDKEEWEKGKCGFKLIQYLSLGIPAVCTDFGVNADIIQHGVNGYLCENEDDWLRYLSELIESKKNLSEMGMAGRRHIEKHYSVNAIEADFLMLMA